jgi:hypothetical protein
MYVQGIIFVSMEKEKKIINWERGFLYTTEYYQQVRQYSSLVVGCHV